LVVEHAGGHVGDDDALGGEPVPVGVEVGETEVVRATATFAVLEHGAAAFIYLLPPGDSLSDTTLNLWAHEVVPAVREAIAKR